jgi:hypothetical protein
LRIREGIGSGAPRMWFRLATNGDEDSKKTAQGWFAAFSPYGRESFYTRLGRLSNGSRKSRARNPRIESRRRPRSDMTDEAKDMAGRETAPKLRVWRIYRRG